MIVYERFLFLHIHQQIGPIGGERDPAIPAGAQEYRGAAACPVVLTGSTGCRGWAADSLPLYRSNAQEHN
jgi:hypothetical protein